jgi:hypothetical protein
MKMKNTCPKQKKKRKKVTNIKDYQNTTLQRLPKHSTILKKYIPLFNPFFAPMGKFTVSGEQKRV